MNHIRVGLIGTGYWARVIHGPGVAQHPHAELAGVWGRDAQKTEHIASQLGTRAFADADQLIEAVDALTFAVPPAVQAPIATRAAERHRHLLLEKPITTSASEAQRLESAVAAAGVGSVVFFTRRFRPEIQTWLERMRSTDDWQTGRAEFASNIFVDGGPFSQSTWRREKGALWDIGPHALALLWPVLGDVRSVMAAGGRGDQVHLVFQHAGGASSTASLTLTAPRAATGDAVYFDGERGRETAPLPHLDTAEVIAAHQAALSVLVDQMQHAGPGHACDVHFGARVVEVLAAAEQSLATGCATPIAYQANVP